MELTIPVVILLMSYTAKCLSLLGMVLLLFLLHQRERGWLLLLFFVLCLHLTVKGTERAKLSMVLPQETVTILCGRVATEPVRRKNRGKGYRLELTSVVDQKGNAGSAKGVVYVITEFSDVTRGDEVALYGTFQDGYFRSSSTELLSRHRFGRGRRKFSALLERHLPQGSSGNLGALLFSGSSLDGNSSLSEAARKYGLSYLLALSGMHLGLLQLLLFPLLAFLGGKKQARFPVLFLLTLFVYSTGWKPSLLRALLFMVLSSLFGTTYGFLFSFVFLLLLEPLAITDLGTVFSFLSLAGILLFSQSLGDVLCFFLPHFPSVGEAVAASLSALVFSVPYTLSSFGSWQPMAILLAFPASFLIVLFFFLELLSLFVPQLGLLLDEALDFFVVLAEKEPLLKEENTLRYWYWMVVVIVFIKLGEMLSLHQKEIEKWMKTRLGDLKDILALWKE